MSRNTKGKMSRNTKGKLHNLSSVIPKEYEQKHKRKDEQKHKRKDEQKHKRKDEQKHKSKDEQKQLTPDRPTEVILTYLSEDKNSSNNLPRITVLKPHYEYNFRPIQKETAKGKVDDKSKLKARVIFNKQQSPIRQHNHDARHREHIYRTSKPHATKLWQDRTVRKIHFPFKRSKLGNDRKR